MTRPFTLLLALLFPLSSLSAQGLLPDHPLRLQIGNIKQSDRNNLAYYSLSLDVYKSKKRPKLSIYSAPTFGLYREGAHSAFSGQGVTATWGLPLSVQVGVGLGNYTATQQNNTATQQSTTRRLSGVGGKVFARWGLKDGLFTEFATIFPATRRLTSTQISIGKRF
jgi:hypothetical protein